MSQNGLIRFPLDLYARNCEDQMKINDRNNQEPTNIRFPKVA